MHSVIQGVPRLCMASLKVSQHCSQGNYHLYLTATTLQIAAQVNMHLFALLLLLASTVTAQFQFFEQMFGGQGGHHHQSQPQNMPSDASWYQQQYEAGKHLRAAHLPSPLAF